MDRSIPRWILPLCAPCVLGGDILARILPSPRAIRIGCQTVIESDYELVQVASGAWSVRSVRDGETFHPVIGPVAEAEALYVQQLRIPDRVRAAGPDGFVVWDVGLGAAANVLTVLRALSNVPGEVRVESFDHTAAPLRFARRHDSALGYFHGFESAVDGLLEQRSVRFQHGACTVHWRFHEADFPTLLRDLPLDIPPPEAVLFDAFSPARNPLMWTLPLFESLHRRIPPGNAASLATYSRSTLLRVTLLLAGFWVGAGEATGEKEETTLAATRPELIPRLLDSQWLGRALRSTSAEPLREPVYRQAPLEPASREALLAHPQFASILSNPHLTAA